MTIQERIDAVFAAGGGTVWIPRGISVVPEPLRLRSRVRLLGQGRFQSTIKLADGASGQAVIMADLFDQAILGNYWNYNAGVPNGGQVVYDESVGLHMGCVVESLTIDGNARGGANANGLCIYGGAYHVNHVGINDCKGHGLWTKCGRPGNSWAGDAIYSYANMHESLINDVSVNKTGGHGVWFNGPNDSYMDKVQVKSAGDTGILLDIASDTATGGLKVGTLHAYSSKNANFNIRGSYISADTLYCDTPGTDGIVLGGSYVNVNNIWCINHNQKRDKVSWGLKLYGSNNFINYYRYSNSQTALGTLHGGALMISTSALDCRIPNGLLHGGGTAVTTKGTATVGDGLVYNGLVREW